ncbi:DUF1959 domain-containing protein [Methanofollis fontis]|uniref:DUF1959 domain-containing protein n=1 Tax=Methanofollis fontis TaxID=2052832 RepID=A0A483CSE1_9EURY|nr:DUF1959 domain-containing protein [Methanofollis fontis]TAJ44100.1 DUF1959 domain-containing protein [Methanofollis fontis]
MTEYLYEKDLRPLKYNVIIGKRQDQTVREMAALLGIRIQKLRLLLIERLDMSNLENMPARFEAGLSAMDSKDPIADALGRDLFVRYVQVFTKSEMEAAYARARSLADGGLAHDDAVGEGKAMLREVISP